MDAQLSLEGPVTGVVPGDTLTLGVPTLTARKGGTILIEISPDEPEERIVCRIQFLVGGPKVDGQAIQINTESFAGYNFSASVAQWEV
jgi:hypothetical protein